VRIAPVEGHEVLVVWLDQYVTWVPTPSSTVGTLLLQVDMGPITLQKDNGPVLVTHEMWERGEQPTEIEGVDIRATCGFLDPEAPSYRKIP